MAEDALDRLSLLRSAAAAKTTEAKVVAHCNAQLANFKVPRYVVLTREPLPRLHTGKIAKPKLRDDYKDAEGRLERVR